MARITDEKLATTARLLEQVYESEFRGKDRGRFSVTRVQLKRALGVTRIDPDLISRLQDHVSDRGFVLVDLDDIFPIIERRILRQYRRPPRAVFNEVFAVDEDEDAPDVFD